MKTKINESNFEAIDDIMRIIRRKKKEIKDLEDAMNKHSQIEGIEAIEITFSQGKSYKTSCEILAYSMRKFAKVLIPALIGVLQAEIDSLYKEIESL